jgi:hypothetical protein
MFALVAATGACDGDDDETTGEEGALSKSEFVQKADKICADLTENGSLVVDGRLIGRVDDLVPPDSEQDTITQLLDQWRDYFDQSSEQTATAANDIARELGLDECVIDS